MSKNKSNNNGGISYSGFLALAKPKYPEPVKAIRRGDRTIIVWSDKVRSIVRLFNEDSNDEKAVAMAYVKRFMPHNTFKKLVANMEFQDEE